MTKNKKLLLVISIILFLLMILWILVIFHFSMQSETKSSNVSKGTLQIILDFLKNTFNIDIPLKSVHRLFRKFAHFSEFFILGIIATAFYYSVKTKPLFAIITGALVSVSDEYIQYLNPNGRAMRVKDIIIDTSGVIFSTIVFYCIWLIIKKIKERKCIN